MQSHVSPCSVESLDCSILSVLLRVHDSAWKESKHTFLYLMKHYESFHGCTTLYLVDMNTCWMHLMDLCISWTWDTMHSFCISWTWNAMNSFHGCTLHVLTGVNANVVAIGTVESPSIWQSALQKDPTILAKIGSKNPRGRVRNRTNCCCWCLSGWSAEVLCT